MKPPDARVWRERSLQKVGVEDLQAEQGASENGAPEQFRAELADKDPRTEHCSGVRWEEDQLARDASYDTTQPSVKEKITQPLLEISKRGVRRDRIIHHDHLVAVVC
jgi:hypothetical protein